MKKIMLALVIRPLPWCKPQLCPKRPTIKTRSPTVIGEETVVHVPPSPRRLLASADRMTAAKPRLKLAGHICLYSGHMVRRAQGNASERVQKEFGGDDFRGANNCDSRKR